MLKSILKRLRYGESGRGEKAQKGFPKSSFARDERGNIMILTAFMAPMLMMAAATAVDLGEMYRAKTNFQTAVDASTLAFAREFGKATSGNGSSPGGVQQRYDAALPVAREVFYANLGNLPSSTGTIDFDVGAGDCNTDGVTGIAELRHELFFPAFHKLIDANVSDGKIGIGGKTTVKCDNSRFEIALVLDNSGSMGSSNKMGTLRSSAITLVNRMFNGMKDRIEDQPLAFSLVPFAATVNVGTQNSDAPWMDTEGRSPIHHENFNWVDNPNAVQNGDTWETTDGETLTRFSIYDELPGISWGGCVEARPHPYQVRDVEADDSNPATLIVPSFAPDTPDNWTGQYDKELTTATGKAICVDWESATYRYRGRRYTRTQRRCTRWSDGWRNDRHFQDYSYRPERDDRIEYRNGNYIGPAVGSVNAWVDDELIDEETYETNNYIKDDHNFPSSLGDPRAKIFTGRGADQHKRQKWTWKYFEDENGNDGLYSSYYGGPNDACTSNPIVELTEDKNELVTNLAHMAASGATNIQQGVIWGWRTLSPQEPFTGGRDPDTPGNRKIMIVMSDGNNTYYPTNLWNRSISTNNKSFYGAWGHSANGRIFEGFDAISNPSHTFDTFRQSMDEHLAETCENAKADNITIYTIAFDVANGSSVQTMLRNCASKDLGGKPLYIDAKNNADLVAAFDSIYESLSELRIAQ